MKATIANAVPQVAVVAPIVAFAVGGTAVPINSAAETVLQVTAWPVLALVAWSVAVSHRWWRVVSGAAMIVWWMVIIWQILEVDHPRTSPFGILSLLAIPVVVASTWGHAWGLADVEERAPGD